MFTFLTPPWPNTSILVHHPGHKYWNTLHLPDQHPDQLRLPPHHVTQVNSGPLHLLQYGPGHLLNDLRSWPFWLSNHFLTPSSLRELIKKKKWKYGFCPNFLLTPPSPLKFGSKNRYQSPEIVPRFLFQYYQNEYQKSLDLGFDPSPPFGQIPYFHYFLKCRPRSLICFCSVQGGSHWYLYNLSSIITVSLNH